MSEDNEAGNDRRTPFSGLLAMHRFAAERGDGLIPGFRELLIRAHQDASGPRLVVVNQTVTSSDTVNATRKCMRKGLALAK
ncbi:MAG: hypothetical protein AAF724_04700 [Pseudomonadota bacterium]